MTTTSDFIREMRELCEKVTPGPYMLPLHEDTVVAKNCQSIAEFYGANRGSNRLFFNAARTALPEALDRLEKLEWFKEASETYHTHRFANWQTIQCGNACKELKATYQAALREAEEGL